MKAQKKILHCSHQIRYACLCVVVNIMEGLFTFDQEILINVGMCDVVQNHKLKESCC